MGRTLRRREGSGGRATDAVARNRRQCRPQGVARLPPPRSLSSTHKMAATVPTTPGPPIERNFRTSRALTWAISLRTAVSRSFLVPTACGQGQPARGQGRLLGATGGSRPRRVCLAPPRRPRPPARCRRAGHSGPVQRAPTAVEPGDSLEQLGLPGRGDDRHVNEYARVDPRIAHASEPRRQAGAVEDRLVLEQRALATVSRR
jgi:hypothetical protein